jgi:hypothetical protein
MAKLSSFVSGYIAWWGYRGSCFHSYFQQLIPDRPAPFLYMALLRYISTKRSYFAWTITKKLFEKQ